MPLETSIGISSPSWDVDVAWPWRYNQAGFNVRTDTCLINGPAFLTGIWGTHLGRTISSLSQGGTGVVEEMISYSGAYAWSIHTTGAVPVHTYGFIPVIPILNASGLGPAFAGRSPGWNRTAWVRFTLALFPGCVLTTASGIALQAAEGAILAQKWAGAGGQPNQGAFGIYGDGAGGLQFIAYDATTPGPAVALTTAAVPAPAVPNQFQTFDLFLTNAGAARTAKLDVYVDGASLAGATGLQFTNLPGGVYFDPDTAGAGPGMCSLNIRNGDMGAGNRMIISEWRIRSGRYTYDGAELAS